MDRTTSFRIAAVLGLLLILSGGPLLAQNRVGGYVYNRGEDRFIRNVWNFVKHFDNYAPYKLTQYYWAEARFFTTQAASFSDYMHLAYYSGHGNYHYMGMGPGAPSPQGVNLRTAGSGNPNYGRNMRWIIFQSCQVIPHVPEQNAGKISSWWSPWHASYGGVFKGLHQAIGYRTNSYSDNGISNNFGSRLKSGQAVWQSWFNAVNDERSWWRGASYPGYASTVMHCSHQNDTIYSYGSRPTYPHGMCGWYQH